MVFLLMPTPSKFVGWRREQILRILRAGGSRRAAARSAGVHHQTLSRWIARGARASPEGRWRAFHDAVLEAEGRDPELTALRAAYESWDTNPAAALAFLEEFEFDPPPDEPRVIQLRFRGPPDLPEP